MESLTPINKSRIQHAFQKALNSYDEHALIQQKMNIKLMTHLQNYLPNLPLDSVLELGCGTGILSALLQKQISADYWLFNDLCDTRPQLAEKLLQTFDFYCGDAEYFPFSQQFDLIISASAVQWFHQPAAFITHCKTGLKTNGLLAVATFGEDNLKEVRHITNIGLSYPTLSQWQKWLANDFELLWSGHFHTKLEFDTPLAVLKHLKNTGVTATNQTHWTKKHLNNFIDDYCRAFRLLSGRVCLTYHPLFFIARYSAAGRQ